MTSLFSSINQRAVGQMTGRRLNDFSACHRGRRPENNAAAAREPHCEPAVPVCRNRGYVTVEFPATGVGSMSPSLDSLSSNTAAPLENNRLTIGGHEIVRSGNGNRRESFLELLIGAKGSVERRNGNRGVASTTKAIERPEQKAGDYTVPQ